MRLPPKAAQAAETVRAMIADGTLLPGGIAPSAPMLQRTTGTSYVYCRLALASLVADGTLEAEKPHGPRRVRADRPASP